MRRCWGCGYGYVGGEWDEGCGMWEVTFARELRWVAVGRAHFGKGAADINLVGVPLDP